jgi:short subunit dehydrogenase-like uncharacterized protein
VIVVYGASGFTGRLVVAELNRRGVDVVPAGRDADRLRAVAPEGEIRAAGLDDPAALATAFRDCRVVINCVAPFVECGAAVVRAAIGAGCHYVDISGERRHIARTFEEFAAPAERAGVSVLPMVNDGGFLVDLVTAVAAARAEPVDDIVVAHRVSGPLAMSRGSARTLLANQSDLVAVPAARHSALVFPDDREPTPVVAVGLPELATIPHHIRTGHLESVLPADMVAGLALTPELVESLPEAPAPGGRFTLLAEVSGAGGRVRGVVHGRNTYGTTAAVAVEAATRLAAGSAKPGVLAPAQAFDPTELLDSLAPHGVRWTVQPLV